jgi:hypothetical protein
MSDYSQLSAQLALVRRAWKRRHALAGLAIVALESVGLFTLLVLADWLYEPAPAVRVAVAAIALVVVAVLLVRHVAAHLVRRITDDQLALYVEEHRQDFQGALMTAAEFGRGREMSPTQSRLVAASMDAAIARASRLDLRSVVRLGRFRKYGWAALALVLGYVAMAALFPSSVGHHAARILTPWRVTAEDLARGPSGRPFEEAAKAPIAFTLTRGDVRVPRGGTVALETVLSRPPDAKVVLHFRPVVEGQAAEWRDLEMTEADRLNGFAASLADVNEDLDYYVSAEDDRSEPHRITVYNPLALTAIEVVTKFAEYLKLDDRVEPSGTGDVAAPVGSTVTVRLMTNNALASGSLNWDGGPRQTLAVGEPATQASTTFQVERDGTYTFTVRDADGQELASAIPSYVRALPDQPPKVTVEFPKIDIATHPLGQVSVVAEAADDFAVASADFVYQLAAEGAPAEVRVPLALAAKADAPPGAGARAMLATGLLQFEAVRPGVEPGQVYTYHLEARDQKGQVAMSDIYMITITPFEQWATWSMEQAEQGGGTGYVSSPLSVVLAAVWHLHTQKATLPATDFDKQAEQLARTMVDPSSGEVFPFIDLEKVSPAKMQYAERIPPLAKKAHAALLAHDTAEAVKFLRLAVAQLAMVGLSEMPTLMVLVGEGAGAPEPEPEAVLAQISTFQMEAEALDALVDATADPAAFEIIGPEYRRELRAIEEAEELKKKAQELQRGEQTILERAMAMADQPPPAEGAAPQAPQPAAAAPPPPATGAQEDPHGAPPPPEGQAEGGQPPPPQGQEAGGAPPPPSPADSPAQLAQDQKALAEATKAAAMDARAAAELDPTFDAMAEKMDDAARGMFQASRKVSEGQVSDALDDIRRAQRNLAEAAESVEGLQRHSLEQALDLAQARAEQLLRRQREARSATQDTAARTPAGSPPDAGVQRDVARLARQQGEIRTEADGLQQELGSLRNLVERGGRRETAKAIDEANRGVIRHQVPQKMANATVELQGARPQAAVPEQQRAEAGLEAVLDSLHAAAGTLASDYKSELRRAIHEADRTAAALERLDPKDAAPDAAQPPGKDEPKPASLAERKDAAQQAAAEMDRLGRHLENRQFTPDEAAQLRRATEDPDRLAQVLAGEEATRQQLLGVVRQTGAKLAAQLEAKLEAERLKDFQREECPPQYRPLVNRYYELLGQGSP